MLKNVENALIYGMLYDFANLYAFNSSFKPELA
jgi:hypothetical protein